jgi:hypothetical protein
VQILPYRKNLGHETQPLQAQWSVPTCQSWNRLPSTEINRCQLDKWPHAGWGQHEVIYMPICPSSSDRFTASIFIESSRNLSIVWTITQGIAASTQYSGIFLGCWADHGYVEFFVIFPHINSDQSGLKQNYNMGKIDTKSDNFTNCQRRAPFIPDSWVVWSIWSYFTYASSKNSFSAQWWLRKSRFFISMFLEFVLLMLALSQVWSFFKTSVP